MIGAKVLRLAPQAPKLLQQSRNMSVIASSPMVKISGAEKALHGFFMVGSFLAIPVWVLVHIKEYRK